MKKLILVNYKDSRTNKVYKELFRNSYQYNKTFDSFNDLNFKDVQQLVFAVTGKTYQEKQNSLRQIAIEFQGIYKKSCDYDLTFSDCSLIADWLESKAKLFGLVKEFKENALI